MNLASFIRDIPDFPKPGIVFKDITPLLLDPGALDAAVSGLAEWARPLSVDFVVAAEARGFILGAALARELGVGFVPARKPGKLPGETVSAEYILEYGVDALEMHADALARRRAGAAARRPAGHRRDGGGARRPGPRARRARSRASGSWSSCRSWAGARSSTGSTSQTLIAYDGGVRREQVFWGWGEPGAGPSLPEHARELLRERAGRLGRRRLLAGGAGGRVAAGAGVAGRAARAPRGGRGGARRRGGAGAARRAGSPTWICWPQRAGEFASAPDAVVAPADAARVAEVLRLCGEDGRGRGAVRGRDERRRRARGGARAVRRRWCRLDLGRLDRVVSIDPRSLVAVFEPGIRLPEADAALRAQGLALGHVPQSLRVGDGRRVRGDAVGRADLDRARADRRAGRGAVSA